MVQCTQANLVGDPMKKTLLCLGLIAALLLAGCGQGRAYEPAQTAAEAPVTIVVASDLHYIAPSLTDNGPLFHRVVANGDGKLTLQVEAIAEAFVDEMLALRPDAVILSGDLSFNGEYDSLKTLADKLQRLKEAGIKVLPLSGNHDIDNGVALRYEGEGWERVKNCSGRDFRQIFRDLGYDEALSVDQGSGSYVFALRSDLRVLMLDTNSAIINAFPEKSLPWVEEQLKRAQEAGARVISVTHQNVLSHNSLFSSGYRIINAYALQHLLENYGVMANLSGHLHIQHAAEAGFTEVLTSPLSLTPCRYGLLRYDGGELSYEAQSLDVAAWAARQGSADEILLHFAEFAERGFYERSYQQIREGHAEDGLEEDTLSAVAETFARANLSYFTGAPVDREALEEGIELWEAQGEGFETAYLRSILQDESPDPLHLVLWKSAEESAGNG